jgi:hypothetical protein
MNRDAKYWLTLFTVLAGATAVVFVWLGKGFVPDLRGVDWEGISFILGVVGIMVVGCAVAVIREWAAFPAIEEKYRKVSIGMAETDVCLLLGPPAESIEHEGWKIAVWVENRCSLAAEVDSSGSIVSMHRTIR